MAKTKKASKAKSRRPSPFRKRRSSSASRSRRAARRHAARADRGRRPPRQAGRRGRGQARATPATTCCRTAWPSSRPSTTCGSWSATRSASSRPARPASRRPQGAGRADRPDQEHHHRGERQRGRATCTARSARRRSPAAMRGKNLLVEPDMVKLEEPIKELGDWPVRIVARLRHRDRRSRSPSSRRRPARSNAAAILGLRREHGGLPRPRATRLTRLPPDRTSAMAAEAPGPDRLPPQSREAERSVLGQHAARQRRHRRRPADRPRRQLLLRRPPEDLPGHRRALRRRPAGRSGHPGRALCGSASRSRTSAATATSPSCGTPPRRRPTPSTTPGSSATRRSSAT